jgi:hypothetical protein
VRRKINKAASQCSTNSYSTHLNQLLLRRALQPVLNPITEHIEVLLKTTKPENLVMADVGTKGDTLRWANINGYYDDPIISIFGQQQRNKNDKITAENRQSAVP